MNKIKGEIGGVQFEELIQLDLIDMEQSIAYVSGSLVEGFGNSNSDIDVFVINDGVPKHYLVETEDKYVTINSIRQRKIDFEYWKPQGIEKMKSCLNSLRLGKEHLGEGKLDFEEEKFIHRLKIGIPLTDPAAFEDFQKQFNFDNFSGYLCQKAIHDVDGIVEDIAGLLDQDNIRLGILRGRDLVCVTIDAYCFFSGKTNNSPKWRYKKVLELEKNETSELVQNDFWKLQYPNIEELLEDTDKAVNYIEDCLAFSHKIVNVIHG